MTLSKTLGVTLVTSALLVFGTVSPAHAQDENVAKMQQFVDLMSSYFGLIHSIEAVATNPETSAIFQMNKIKEIYEEQGKRRDVVPVLEKALSDAHSPAVRNAAYMLLSDVYKETRQEDKAIELLRKALEENIASANGS